MPPHPRNRLLLYISIRESCGRDKIVPSGSLGGNKNEFSVIACSQAKDVGYTVFDVWEKLISNNKEKPFMTWCVVMYTVALIVSVEYRIKSP